MQMLGLRYCLPGFEPFSTKRSFITVGSRVNILIVPILVTVWYECVSKSVLHNEQEPNSSVGFSRPEGLPNGFTTFISKFVIITSICTL